MNTRFPDGGPSSWAFRQPEPQEQKKAKGQKPQPQSPVIPVPPPVPAVEAPLIKGLFIASHDLFEDQAKRLQPQPPMQRENIPIDKQVALKEKVSSAPPEKIQVGRLEQIGNLFRYAWGCIKNPLDPPWRSQKYEYVMEELGRSFKLEFSEKQREALFSRKVLSDASSTQPNEILVEEDSQSPSYECKQYLFEALSLLYPEKGKEQKILPRERYKTFMEAFTKALETSYYKEKVKEGQGGLTAAEMKQLENDNPEIAALHAIARAQFMGVHVTSFMNSVSQKIADAGGEKPLKIEDNEFQQATDKKKFLSKEMQKRVECLDKIGNAVANADPEHKTYFWTSWFSSIKGQVSWLDFDPLNTGGNPANVHYTRRYPEGDCMVIRTPSPTIGKKIHPAFKALLRSMKARGEHYAYFNLQDRTSPQEEDSLWKKVKVFFGLQAEYLRVQALESLNNDPEFNEVIRVASLDKESLFYWQIDAKAALQIIDKLLKMKRLNSVDIPRLKKLRHEIQSDPHHAKPVEELVGLYVGYKLKRPPGVCIPKDQFITQFHNEIFNGRGYHIPPPYNQKVHQDYIKYILESIGKSYYKSEDLLTPLERQDFIEIAYDLIEDYMMNTSTHTTVVCKDNADRGGAENAKKEGKDLLIDIAAGIDDETIVKQVESWHEMVDALPLWARKRPILESRRRRLKSVMFRMIKFARTNETEFVELQKLTRVVLPATPSPLPFPTGPQVEKPQLEEAVVKYQEILKNITDKFDQETLIKTLESLQTKNLEQFGKEEKKQVLACMRNCLLHRNEIQEHLDRLNYYCSGDLYWEQWRDRGIKGLEKNALNAPIFFIEEKISEPLNKFFLIQQIVDAIQIEDILSPSSIFIEYVDKQQADIAKRKIGRIKRSTRVPRPPVQNNGTGNKGQPPDLRQNPGGASQRSSLGKGHGRKESKGKGKEFP